MALITIYHGTDINSARNIFEAQKADVNIGSNKVDFGPGFYTTDDLSRAEFWAKRKAMARGTKPAVVKMFFDKDAADQDELIEYFDDDLRWGRFVINNRNGLKYIEKVRFKEHNLDSRYAITYGRVADVDVVDVAEKLKTNEELLNSIDGLLNVDYPKQFVFHTNESISYIKKYSYTNL